MAIILSMPKWGLAMKTGLVVEWLKHPGDAVQQGEPIVEIESEKASNEVEAPATGTLRFLVVPEGCDALAVSPRRRVLCVRFGQAFGTGEHATTQMCLRLLGEHLRPDERVIDLGTGSGILAMAACRLGAGQVVAVDDDPAALAVARANLTDNDLVGRVKLRRADAAAACQPGPFDLALVNIGASTIEGLLPHLAPALTRGGRAVLAGLLMDDEDRLLRAAAGCGLVLLDRRRLRPWSALVLRRP